MPYTFGSRWTTTRLTLEEDRLLIEDESRQIPGRTRAISFDEVREVCLYRGDLAWCCRLTLAAGPRLTFPDATWQGERWASQGLAYRAFVVELHRRLARVPDVRYRAGLPLPVALFLACALLLLLLGLLGLGAGLVELVRHGFEWRGIGVIGLCGLLAIVGCSRVPRLVTALRATYHPEALPESLLPPAETPPLPAESCSGAVPLPRRQRHAQPSAMRTGEFLAPAARWGDKGTCTTDSFCSGAGSPRGSARPAARSGASAGATAREAVLPVAAVIEPIV